MRLLLIGLLIGFLGGQSVKKIAALLCASFIRERVFRGNINKSVLFGSKTFHDDTSDHMIPSSSRVSDNAREIAGIRIPED